MTDERYKALMADLGMPNSRSLLSALQQVANEVAQAERKAYAELRAQACRARNLIECGETAAALNCLCDAIEVGFDHTAATGSNVLADRPAAPLAAGPASNASDGRAAG